jgi:hypothetical protein
VDAAPAPDAWYLPIFGYIVPFVNYPSRFWDGNWNTYAYSQSYGFSTTTGSLNVIYAIPQKYLWSTATLSVGAQKSGACSTAGYNVFTAHRAGSIAILQGFTETVTNRSYSFKPVMHASNDGKLYIEFQSVVRSTAILNRCEGRLFGSRLSMANADRTIFTNAGLVTGLNNVTVYCVDGAGNHHSATQSFSIVA